MKKVILFALIVGLCLLSVHAGTQLIEPNDEDLELLIDNGGIEIDNFGILSPTWRVLRSILRTVKGLNCLIQWVVGIQSSALQFNQDVINCGITASKEVQAVVNANLAIISTCNDIINLKTNVCDTNTDETSGKLSKTCTSKTLAKFFSLYKQVNKAVKLTKKIPQTGVNASSCIVISLNTLTSYYTQFPSQIKQCSKLTS